MSRGWGLGTVRRGAGGAGGAPGGAPGAGGGAPPMEHRRREVVS